MGRRSKTVAEDGMKIPKDLIAKRFIIRKFFPPDDQLAVDLLRLMAGLNDIDFLHEWVMENQAVPKSEAGKVLAASLWGLQFRLLASVLHEILNVIEEMERLEGFAALQERMVESGRLALRTLSNVRNGTDKFSSKFLAMTRHQTAYHYDRAQFRSALGKVLKRFGSESDTYGILRSVEGKPQFHNPVPEFIRTEISRGLTGVGGGIDELKSLLHLEDQFHVFYRDIFVAYCQSRDIDPEELGVSAW